MGGNPWQALKLVEETVREKRAVVERKRALLAQRCNGSDVQFERLEAQRADAERLRALGRMCEEQSKARAHSLLDRLRRCQRPLSAAERALAAEVSGMERGVRALERRAEDCRRDADFVDNKLRRAERVVPNAAGGQGGRGGAGAGAGAGADGGAGAGPAERMALLQEESDLAAVGSILAQLDARWAAREEQ